MAETFSREHFQTAQQYGLDYFSDAYILTTAELALTMPKLLRHHGPFALSIRDLQGYHFLQYGTDPDIVNEVANIVSGDSCNDLSTVQTLKENKFSEIVTKRPLMLPLLLGRVALSKDTQYDSALDYFTEKVAIDDGPSGSQRFGEFLYPINDSSLYFLGRRTVEIAHAGEPRYSRRFSGGSLAIDELATHVDIFKAVKDGLTFRFTATSIEENGRATLRTIESLLA